MVSTFKKNIEASLMYIHFYGIIAGLKISLKFLFHLTNIVKLKDIKSPIKLRKETSDIPTFHKVFGFREYAIKQFPQDTKIIVDGGANIGLFSIFIKNIFPDAKVIAIEPDMENFGLMIDNLHYYTDIIPLNYGLWNSNILLKASDKYNQGKWGIVVEEVADAKDSNVKGISINEIMAQNNISHIDILKIDIETSEKFLFEKNYQSWLPKIKMIIIEFHDWITPGTAQPVLKAINECFHQYSFYMKGENAIIINESFQV